MQGFRLCSLIRFQVVVIAVIFLQSCGVALTGTPTPCGAGTAQIEVYETFLTRTCGCLESRGASFGPGQPLICTVPVGTKVFFYYPNITGPHQIQVGPGATGTPLYHNPQSNPETNPVDAITLNSTSTGISFIDITTMNGGTFIVQ